MIERSIGYEASDGGDRFCAYLAPMDALAPAEAWQSAIRGAPAGECRAAETIPNGIRPAPLAEAWSSLLPVGGPAETLADPGAPETAEQRKRNRLWSLRETAARIEPWDHHRRDGTNGPSRIAMCGKVALPSGAYFGKRDNLAGVYGVQTCGRAWTCAVCRARAAAHHTEEITRAWQAWHAAGGRAYFATFTIRHTAHDDPETLRRGLADAWARMTSGAWWHKWRTAAGAEYVRALDVTHGFHNGWHLHYHVILFTKADFPEADLRKTLYARWDLAVKKTESLGPSHAGNAEHSVDLENAAHGDALAGYLAKLGLELAGDLYKVGAQWNDHRTPWEILADAECLRKKIEALDPGSPERELWAGDELRAIELWKQFSGAMRGARWFAWSSKLRDVAGLGTEISDEEAAALESKAELEVVAVVPDELRKRVLRYRVIRGILDCIERGLPIVPYLETFMGAAEVAIWEHANSRESIEAFQRAREARLRGEHGT